MMGRQRADQAQFFYSFHLEERVPAAHLLRKINVFVSAALADVHREMAAFYSHTGRPSIDPELMMRMLIVGYCYGIRSERKLCEEVSLNLAYRWFCRLDLDDAGPDHSTFSKNRHGRFRESDLLRLVFERVVGICLATGLRSPPTDRQRSIAGRRTEGAPCSAIAREVGTTYEHARRAISHVERYNRGMQILPPNAPAAFL